MKYDIRIDETQRELIMNALEFMIDQCEDLSDDKYYQINELHQMMHELPNVDDVHEIMNDFTA